MPGPGEYRRDPTEGITRIKDLPKPNVSLRSRNYRRRPCPRCGHSSYRDRAARCTLHGLGDTLTGRPRGGVSGGGLLFCCHGVTSGSWRGASEANSGPSKATLFSVRLLD